MSGCMEEEEVDLRSLMLAVTDNRNILQRIERRMEVMEGWIREGRGVHPPGLSEVKEFLEMPKNPMKVKMESRQEMDVEENLMPPVISLCEDQPDVDTEPNVVMSRESLGVPDDIEEAESSLDSKPDELKSDQSIEATADTTKFQSMPDLRTGSSFLFPEPLWVQDTGQEWSFESQEDWKQDLATTESEEKSESKESLDREPDDFTGVSYATTSLSSIGLQFQSETNQEQSKVPDAEMTLAVIHGEDSQELSTYYPSSIVSTEFDEPDADMTDHKHKSSKVPFMYMLRCKPLPTMNLQDCVKSMRVSGSSEGKKRKRKRKKLESERADTPTELIDDYELADEERPKGKRAKNGVKYKCELCTFITKDKSKLTLHHRSHTGEKPYACNICAQKFALKSNLKGHVTSVHLGIKSYSCDECGEQFKRSFHLKRHMLRQHTGEMPYTCPTCYMKFPRSDYLKKHVKCHELMLFQTVD